MIGLLSSPAIVWFPFPWSLLMKPMTATGKAVNSYDCDASLTSCGTVHCLMAAVGLFKFFDVLTALVAAALFSVPLLCFCNYLYRFHGFFLQLDSSTSNTFSLAMELWVSLSFMVIA